MISRFCSSCIFNFFSNFLAVLALLTVGSFFYEMFSNEWRAKPSVRNVYALTMFSFVTGLCALSIFPHQEPRFLIPLIVPIVLMNAHKLRFVTCCRMKREDTFFTQLSLGTISWVAVRS